MDMLGMRFYTMKRKGICHKCRCELKIGVKSVILGSYSNEYRYCCRCFLTSIEDEFVVEILDFINIEEINIG